MDQCERVLERLNRGPLTSFEAQVELGVARLASRIHDLKDRGEAIDVEMIEVPTRTGDKARVAQYRLKHREELF